jgi:serine/threonine-protein kinase RsbT
VVTTSGSELPYRLCCDADRLWCAGEARRFACRLGFKERAQWELAVVVAELVSNAVQHAGSGTLLLRRAVGPRRGIEVVVSDQGPGMDSEEAAPRHPGVHRAGLGIGLRTVRCLMDVVSIASARGRGTVVTAVRFLEP